MKKLYIIKAGTTFPATAQQFGDFDKWTETALGKVNVETAIVDAEHSTSLPTSEECAGAVITGSHSMVTDNLPWSVKLEEWIRSLLDSYTPLFGICYGHQLLARAAGGQVGNHPRGKEIGTVSVHLLSECTTDPVFQSLPQSFLVHVTHLQTVLRLPTGATRLAANAYEPNHAFRVEDWAYGVQFHPEYNADIMRSYIQEQKNELDAAGMDVPKLLDTVEETPVAVQTLRNFGNIVIERLANK
ncbi:MAG: glutamine amidotransferase [delta proteobacterium ML8_D]|jgi:GMP synthase (glutamine-hydrolysing)|nr:MAG: glutamine amidotransferase [delta proteobacterium ML8_D]